MAKVTRAEWYRRVNAEWEGVKVPALTAEEAIRAAKKLYRFEMGKAFNGEVRATSGNRRLRIGRAYTRDDRMFGRVGRRVMVVNPERGWKGLAHELSHWLDFLNGNGKHNSQHARCEIRIIKEIKKRGWLEGKLRTPERPAAEARVAELTRDTDANKIERLTRRREAWEKKLRRAERAIAKIRKSLRYYERKAEKKLLDTANG